MRTALIDADGKAVQVLVATVDQVAVPAGLTAVSVEHHVGVGEIWDGSTWTFPKPNGTPDQVNAERDARIAAGFTFGGRHYQWNSEAIASRALDATVAVANQVQAGDLRWHGGDSDFTWRASDNTEVPMDAPTMQALHAAMTEHREKMHKAAIALKAMDPIPSTFDEDQHWT